MSVPLNSYPMLAEHSVLWEIHREEKEEEGGGGVCQLSVAHTCIISQ